jgi:hypothetical protein
MVTEAGSRGLPVGEAGESGSEGGATASQGGSAPQAGEPSQGGTANHHAGNSGSSGMNGGGGSAPVDQTPGQSRCYGVFSDALLCEGFEAPALPSTWAKTESGGSAARIGYQTFLGDGALEGKVTMGGGKGFATRAGLGGLASGSLHVRAYLYVAAGPPLLGITTLHLSGNPTAVSVLLIDTGVIIVIQPNGNNQGEVVAHGGVNPYVITRDEWHCLQLEIGISSAEGFVKLVMDGQRVAVEQAGLNTKPATGYQNVAAGILYADPAQGAARVLFDELVVDDSLIPCD